MLSLFPRRVLIGLLADRRELISWPMPIIVHAIAFQPELRNHRLSRFTWCLEVAGCSRTGCGGVVPRVLLELSFEGIEIREHIGLGFPSRPRPLNLHLNGSRIPIAPSFPACHPLLLTFHGRSVCHLIRYSRI